jgi:hypothetical protein
MARRIPPRKVSYFEPVAQHRNRVHIRGRAPVSGADAGRLRPARPRRVVRPEPGEWHPYMPECLAVLLYK